MNFKNDNIRLSCHVEILSYNFCHLQCFIHRIKWRTLHSTMQKKKLCFMENNAANDTKSKVKTGMTTLNELLVTR